MHAWTAAKLSQSDGTCDDTSFGASIAVGGWAWLLRRNRGRIEAEKKRFGRGSPEGRRKRLKLG
jgi:hypothetical protein